MPSFDFFAPCPRGLETPLAAELREIAERVSGTGLSVGKEVPGGVHFRGSPTAGMAVNLHARVASRVLLKIDERGYRDENDIYELALSQQWEHWFSAQQTLRVDVTAIKSPLRSLEFVTLRVKDAICDRLRERTGARPFIDTAAPDVRVFVFLTATACTLYLDTSGEALFKRGWRLDKGAAPLRENLAAGILRLAGWQPRIPLYDPMCGSGTFIAEAAQISLQIPAGGERHFAFEQLKQYDAAAWQKLRAAARDRQDVAARAFGEYGNLQIYGSDISGDILEKARSNLQRAGLPPVPLKQLDARAMVVPGSAGAGIIVMNPPYGERINVRGAGPDSRHPRPDRGHRAERWQDDQAPPAEPQQQHDDGDYSDQHGAAEGNDGARRARPDANPADAEFFKAFGDALKQRFAGWSAFVLSPDRGLPGQMRLRESRKTPLFNGAIECRLFRFDLVEGSLQRTPRSAAPDAGGV